jgi:hypothetical protein
MYYLSTVLGRLSKTFDKWSRKCELSAAKRQLKKEGKW